MTSIAFIDSIEFSIQLGEFDASKSFSGMRMEVLTSLCSALIEKNTNVGLVSIGQLNLWHSLDLVYNAFNLAEVAVEKGATTLLITLNARKQLNDLSNDVFTKINIQYHTDLKDCLIKAFLEQKQFYLK